MEDNKMRAGCIWVDKKRHLGMPISFTKYTLTDERIYLESGFLNLRESELLLYRVKDIGLTRTLWQRIFGFGTIHVYSSDTTDEHLDIVNIKKAKDVKDLISSKVEEAKKSRRIGTTEIIGSEVDAVECGR